MKNANNLKSDNIKKLLQQATTCFQQGLLEEAQDLSQKLLELSPGHAAASYLSGLIAGQRGDYTQACCQIRTAINNNLRHLKHLKHGSK